MTSLLKILDEKIKQDKNHTPDFELAISWTPDPDNEENKIYSWVLVKPNFPDSDYSGYSSLEIQGHEWQYVGKWHQHYPKNIMSLEDFFEGYFEGYFENRETPSNFNSFFKSLKKSYIKTEVSKEVKYNLIFELMNNFLVRYVNKFLIYTNKIKTSPKLKDLYKLYMEYTDSNITDYIKKYVDKKLEFEKIVNTSEEGFYIAVKKKDSEDSEDSEDSKEYVWTFITKEGELKVYETPWYRRFHKIYGDHPYDEFFTLENFFDKYTKGSIEIDEVEEDKFFKSLSPEKLKKREPQYEDIFTPFFEGDSTKNLFKNLGSKPKRLFKLQELYYKFDKIKELAELAELNQDYLNFLKNKIGTDTADVELFKECDEPKLYISTTDNKLYLGYCGIFQGYYNSIDDREKFYPPPTSPPAQSLIELYDLKKYIEQLETLEIDCRYKTSRGRDRYSFSGVWDTKCEGDIQKNLDKIRKKILEKILEYISNKNDSITINVAQKIYKFLFNNFHIKGEDENENENIGKIMKNDFLKDIHDSVEKTEVVWVGKKLGILYSDTEGVAPQFYPADTLRYVGTSSTEPFTFVEKLEMNDLNDPEKVEAILKHRNTSYIYVPLQIKINEFLTSEIKQNKNVNKENIKVYSEYEPQLFQKMFNTHLDLLEFVIEENCDIFFKIIFKDKYYNNKYYKVGTSEMIEKMDEFTGKLDIETTKKIIDKLITAIDYLEISVDKINTIQFPELDGGINNILEGCSNLVETVELIKHIRQQDRSANSYFLQKIEKIYTSKLSTSGFLNIPPPPLPLDLPLFTLEGDSIKDKQTHFNKIKEEYEEQKGKYIDEYYNYNSKIKELNDLISIINDDPQYKQHIKDPQEKWKEEPAYHGKREEDLQNLRNRLLELEKAQVKEDLAKFKKAQIYRESPEFYANSARDLMIFLIKNINILLDETQFDHFMTHITEITENKDGIEDGIEKMLAANITIEKFSSYIANENIKQPDSFPTWSNPGMLITFQDLIETLFNSNDVFRFKFDEYEWSWNGVSQKINTHENPYERYKTFFHNIDRFKKEFLDKTQSVQNGKINSYEYYIKLIYDSTYMKYKDSLYIIFILHEQGVTNLTNLIETLPETGRDKNILNNFIENIIYNNIDKKKFIKVLDILYEKHTANYIEIFEQAILENYENILKFIDTEDKPEYIQYIYEKYEKYLISNSNNIYYKKPSNENPFAKTPFISYEKIQSYYKKNETSEKKKIIRVHGDVKEYYYSYKIQQYIRSKKAVTKDRFRTSGAEETKRGKLKKGVEVFILNNNPQEVYIDYTEVKTHSEYKRMQNWETDNFGIHTKKRSGYEEGVKFTGLVDSPEEAEEYKFNVEISNLYQQEAPAPAPNAEQPDNLTLALALGNAST